MATTKRTRNRLTELAEEAIDEVFSDTTVSPERTMEALQSLQGLIELKIGALKVDKKRRCGVLDET
jgi:hypothetical protein